MYAGVKVKSLIAQLQVTWSYSLDVVQPLTAHRYMYTIGDFYSALTPPHPPQALLGGSRR
jgi:hypothetical protein